MILVDTSVWVEHLNRPLQPLAALASEGRCMLHPFVLGEIALGNLPQWQLNVARLRALPSTTPIAAERLLELVDQRGWQGSGLGLVDAHLLAWAISEPGRGLWTFDRRLNDQAAQAGVAWAPAA